MYLKAASQEGTANIASSPPLRPSSGRLSQSRGQRKCTALCHERPLRVRATVVFRVSRILFLKPQDRFTRSRFNDGLLSPSVSSTTNEFSRVRATSIKIARSIRVTFAYFELKQQRNEMHFTYIYIYLSVHVRIYIN